MGLGFDCYSHRTARAPDNCGYRHGARQTIGWDVHIDLHHSGSLTGSPGGVANLGAYSTDGHFDQRHGFGEGRGRRFAVDSAGLRLAFSGRKECHYGTRGSGCRAAVRGAVLIQRDGLTASRAIGRKDPRRRGGNCHRNRCGGRAGA